jgi:hypothetical protein
MKHFYDLKELKWIFLGHIKIFNLTYKEIDLQSVVSTFQFRKKHPLNVISKKMGGMGKMNMGGINLGRIIPLKIPHKLSQSAPLLLWSYDCLVYLKGMGSSDR